MRGLGIIFIVVGHLWRWPPGVYAMLDMFFVLSGFLITGILIAALPTYGGRFFAVFYLGRIRRLMPAAITVLVLTTALFYLLTSRERGDLVAEEAALAGVWVINWHFALSGTDYFAERTASSPLVHYWSLSVEEQFYLVWPLVILVILFLARRRKSPEAGLLIGLGVVTLGSFGYSMWHSVAAPIAAYYSTLDRIWEFGVGGLVAVLAPRLARLPFLVGAALGWGGVAGLLASLYLLPFGVPFPAPWGLIPVLLTAAILAGGIDRDTRYLPMLDNRPMIYLGDISYSVYLWHLPINLLLLPMFPGRGVAYFASAIGLTVALSVATYHLLERPMRRATWLMTPPERERVRARPAATGHRRPGWVALALTPVVVLSVLVLTPIHQATSSDSGVTPVGLAPVDPVLAEQQQRIIDALEQTTFPDLDPPLEDLGLSRWRSDMTATGCADVSEMNVDNCRFGSRTATRLAVVVGDSYAMAWMPGIRAALEPLGWAVQQLTLAQCPAWTLPTYLIADGRSYPECESHHRLVVDWVLEQRPDLVVLATAADQVSVVGRSGLPDTRTDVARIGSAATFADLLPSGARIAALGSPPPHTDMVECKTRFGTPEACVSHPDASWWAAAAGERSAAETAGVEYVDTSDWFCYGSRCPGFVGTTPVTVDGGHLTIEYSRELAPLLREALVGGGRRRLPLHQDSDRAVVDRLHLHVGPEDTALHPGT